MKKKSIVLFVSAGLVCSLLFSSCIGSFNLTKKLLEWNRGVDSKFVNELVFIAFCIVPVYEIALIADVLVVNSIEFWKGENPVADTGTVKSVHTRDGVYVVETKTEGYHIQKEGEEKTFDLVFDQADNSWSVKAGEDCCKLFRFEGEDDVVMFLPDGSEMPVELTQAGMLAFRQVAQSYTCYAAR